MTTEVRPTATAPARGRPTPQLSLVEAPSRRAARLRRTLVSAFVAVLVVTLFAVGLIQAQLVQRQHRLDELRSEIAATRAQQLRLTQEVLVASSPGEIVRRATEMGMVRAQDPVYLVAVRPAVDG
jgi:cell division protein FtsL